VLDGRRRDRRLRPLGATRAKTPLLGRIRAKLSRRAPLLAHPKCNHAHCTTIRNMNPTSRNPVPAKVSASSNKSITLLQMLALIGASGLVVSLAARYFL
jgi:hypothetical protein